MRILRNHVMVRVGGGWDTLENYLNKHDPCRCQRHRQEKHIRQHFIIERHEKGHVVKEVKGTPSSVKSDLAKERRRTTTNSSATPARSPATARRAVNLNQSLPVERSRPLKGESSSASRMKKHRSQTPSRSRIGSSTPPRSSSATPYSNHTPMTTAKTPRTKRLSSQESMAPGKSRESSQDRKTNMKVYRDDRLTLEDLEPATKGANSSLTKRPKSAVEMAAQSLSVSLHGVTGELVKPRIESRPGSSRSRIPVPVGRRANTRSPSPFFSNESPERADSGIDIYNDFESPTNTMRRRAEAIRPPDIIE